eukprot:2661100-Amphidinium_carterae.2
MASARCCRPDKIGSCSSLAARFKVMRQPAGASLNTMTILVRNGQRLVVVLLGVVCETGVTLES